MEGSTVDQFAHSREDWMGNMEWNPENDLGDSSGWGSRIWVTSDTHFNHKNILVYEAANRPFANKHEMDNALIERWNERVGKDDIVLHLGDFAFAGANKIQEIVSRLNGKIYLLLGNHDRVRQFDWNSLGFARVFADPFMLDGRFIFSHEPLVEVPAGKVNVFGHVHGSSYFQTKTDNSFCACVERHDCGPVAYEYIKGLFPV